MAAEKYFKSKSTGAVKSASEIYSTLMSQDKSWGARSPSDVAKIYAASPDYDEVPDNGRTLGGFGKNILSSGQENIKSVVSAVTSPVQTLGGIADIAVGTIANMTRGGVPMPRQQAVADAAGQHFKERYGGMENIKKTAYEDPVGMVADVASVLSLGGGAALGAGKAFGAIRSATTGASIAPRVASVLQKGGRAAMVASDFIDPLTAPIAAVRATLPPRKLGQRIYEGALRPSANTLEEIDRHVAFALKNDIDVSTGGVEKLRSMISQNTGRVDDIAKQADAAGYTINSASILSALDGLSSQYNKGSFPRQKTRAIEKLKEEFRKKYTDPTTGLPVSLSFEEATDMLRENYHSIELHKDPYGGTRKPIQTEAEKAVDKVIVAEMIKTLETGPNPDLRRLGGERRRIGMEQNSLIRLRDDIGDTLVSMRGKPLVRDVVGAGSGARVMTGNPTPFGVAAILRSVLEAPRRASRIGLNMQKRVTDPRRVLPAINVAAAAQKYLSAEPPAPPVSAKEIDPYR